MDDFLRGDKEVQKELFQEWEVSPEVRAVSTDLGIYVHKPSESASVFERY